MELKNVEIIRIGELKTFASGFSLVEFIVRDDSVQYPQELQLQANKEKAENLIKFNKVGDRVDISYNLQGRSWLKEGETEENRKWFNTIVAWKVFKAEGNVAPPQEQLEPSGNFSEEIDDDLPY